MVARTSHVFPEGDQVCHASSTITVVAGLIQQGGRLLVCQRRRDGAFALKWEFPGGKVEPGETHEHGLRRELREELGIEAHMARKPTVRAMIIQENTRWNFCYPYR